MSLDLSKIGFFYQTAHNPCSVEMNLKQIKKHYPNSPIVVWEDVSYECKDICEKYNVPYKRVFRLTEDQHFHQSLPVTEISGGLRYLNRIFVSCMNELKDAEWIMHYEDDVWIKQPINELPKTEWGGCMCIGWTSELMSHLENVMDIKGSDRLHGACGGTLISRQSFIDAYLKIQDIDWVNISKKDASTGRYSDAFISFLLLSNKCKWSEWNQWSQAEWLNNRNVDFKVYERPIIHCIKYWYNQNIKDLDQVNNTDNVKFFLEHNS